MKNNNLHKNKAFEFCLENAPVILLNQPQLGENVGMVARAMLNCGLSDLRLISPRHTMDMDQARKVSVKAFHVMDNMKIFETLADATQDIHYIYATTARTRDQSKKVVTPEIMIHETIEHIHKEIKVAYLFGKESVGLSNTDVAFANAILTIPLNPAFSSLNLAQSVLVCAYEWSKSVLTTENTLKADTTNTESTENAQKHHMEKLYEDIFQRLDNTSFFNITEKRQHTEDQIRNIFNKIPLSHKEYQLLRGMFRFINNS